MLLAIQEGGKVKELWFLRLLSTTVTWYRLNWFKVPFFSSTVQFRILLSRNKIINFNYTVWLAFTMLCKDLYLYLNKQKILSLHRHMEHSECQISQWPLNVQLVPHGIPTQILLIGQTLLPMIFPHVFALFQQRCRNFRSSLVLSWIHQWASSSPSLVEKEYLEKKIEVWSGAWIKGIFGLIIKKIAACCNAICSSLLSVVLMKKQMCFSFATW